MKNKGYVCVMDYGVYSWYWYIRTSNGHLILGPRYYKNKSQCRRVGKKFAESVGLTWIEE